MGNVMAKAAEVCREAVRSIKRLVQSAVQEVVDKAVDFVASHTRIVKIAACTTAGAGAAILLSPLVITGVLPAIGFTGAGVAACSLAAMWQSVLGDVVAGSLFAMLQSAGAGGYGVAAVTGVLASAGGIGGAAHGIVGAGPGSAPGGARRIGPGPGSSHRNSPSP